MNPLLSPRKRRRTARAVVLTVTASLVVAACGSNNDETANTTAAVTTLASAPAVTSAPTEAPAVTEPTETTVAPTTTVQDLDVSATAPCDVEPVILTTEAGVDFVRTPDSCFDNLPNWDYETKYVELDGLRQAYVDEGPADGEVVLLLHGQPSWSYLYHSTIPGLVDAGYRVIAMDHLGMGRSDKPTELSSYSFDNHVDRLKRFVTELGITDATLYGQDQGSVIGLWAVAEEPDMFSRIGISGGIPNKPKADELPAEDDPNIDGFDAQIAMMPEQQQPFFDANGQSLVPIAAEDAGGTGGFGTWVGYAYWSEKFQASRFVEALTYRPLSAEEERRYDAPFPSRIYMGGARTFPYTLNGMAGRTDAQRAKLTERTDPFITIIGGNDPGLIGEGDGQPWLIENMLGAAGQEHHRYPEASHFLQEDVGPDLAARLDAFIKANPL
jgi:haloalkane dehalogenase